MNRRVKILKIFAAMPNQRPRERRPGFFGHFDGAGNEELVVQMHNGTNIEHPICLRKAMAGRSWNIHLQIKSTRSNGIAQKATRGRARTPKAVAKRRHVRQLDFAGSAFGVR